MEAVSPIAIEFPAIGREALAGPYVRVLNLGGLANPDVLHVQLDSDRSLIVKDYAPRGAWVRSFAPLLVRHERAMLELLIDLHGIPAPGPQIDELAFAMERIEGQPLRMRSHHHALPPAFFSELREILEGLAERGVIYTDLRSPSNVLVRSSGSPALVDLGSALRIAVPRRWVRWFEERALRKLRARYECTAGVAQPLEPYDGPVHLHGHRRRIRLWDSGPLADPVPIVVLPEAALGVEVAAEFVAAATAHGRRVVVLEPPGFAGSRAPLRRLHPRRVADELERTLGWLRLPRVDLVAYGWSGLPARWLAARPSGRVRALLTVDTPADWLEEPFLGRWRQACSNPRAALAELRERIAHHPAQGALAAGLRPVRAAMLQRAYRAVPARPGPKFGWENWRLYGAPEPLCPWLAERATGRADGAPGPIGLSEWKSDAEDRLEGIESLVAH